MGLVLASFSCAVARAQSGSYFDRNNNIGVLERRHPDYDALGLLVGAFQVLPTLSVSPSYDSNIFATSDRVQSDLITSIQPALVARSNWSRHELDVQAQLSSNIYASHASEDTTDYSFGANGRLDILAQSNMTLGLAFSHNTIPRTAEDTFTNASRPVQDSSATVNFGAIQTLNRVRFTETTSVTRLQYDSTTDDLGRPLSLADLNDTIVTEGARADYAIGPEIAVFVTGQGNERDFTSTQGLNALDRSSSGYQLALGSDFDITRLVRGQIQLGYLDQVYRSSVFHTVSGPAVQASVTYFLTDLTNVTLVANRDVIDAVDPVAVSYLQTKGGLQIDHELLRNLILSARTTYEKDVFKGVQRNDDRVSASLSGTYLLNHYLGLTGVYSILSESSSGSASFQDYIVNVFSLSLVLHL